MHLGLAVAGPCPSGPTRYSSLRSLRKNQVGMPPSITQCSTRMFSFSCLGLRGQEDRPAAGPDPAMVEDDVGAAVQPDGVRVAEAQRQVLERDVVAVREEDRVVLFPGQRQTQLVRVGHVRIVVGPVRDVVGRRRQPDVDPSAGSAQHAWSNQIPGPM